MSSETGAINYSELAKFTESIVLNKRVNLKCEKDHFYYLVSGTGLAKIASNTTEVLMPDSLWNTCNLPTCTITALSQCEILKFSDTQLTKISAGAPLVFEAINTIQSQNLQAVRLRLYHNQNLESAQRVAALMIELSKGEYEFVVLPTQIELSELLGISREAFNKSVRSFIKKGWMVKLGRTHKITNRAELVEFSKP